jgi:hypothetical protein
VTSEQHESAIRSATALLPTCGEAYRRGNGQLRREYNLAWFEQIRFSTKDGKPHIARVERTGLISALRTAEIAPNGTKPKATHKPFETVLHIAHDVAEPVHSERPGSLHYWVSSLVRGSKVASLVVLGRLLSNPSSSPLLRAIRAYRGLDLSHFCTKRASHQRVQKRALRLTDMQIARLAEYYGAGATVYELAANFSIDRRTVARRLKAAGVTLRGQSPTTGDVDEMVQLYRSGLSLARVSDQVGFNADTVQRYVQARGVRTRDTHGRERS